jgi:hypothetical protein
VRRKVCSLPGSISAVYCYINLLRSSSLFTVMFCLFILPIDFYFSKVIIQIIILFKFLFILLSMLKPVFEGTREKLFE